LEIVSTTSSPEIKLLNHIAYDVASNNDTNFASVVEVETKDLHFSKKYPPQLIRRYILILTLSSQGSQ